MKKQWNSPTVSNLGLKETKAFEGCPYNAKIQSSEVVDWKERCCNCPTDNPAAYKGCAEAGNQKYSGPCES
ncbi:MAG: hypothetical protein RR940_03620 [Bacilli bacterium]